jgi:UPF0755 protein
MENSILPENVQNRALNIKKIIFYAIGLIVFLLLFYFFLLSAPSNFPVPSVARIEPGMSLRNMSDLLKKEHLIRSRTVFEFSVIILGGEKHIISADYLFEKKLSVWQMAERITGGEHRMAPVSVTIPEGFDINQIGETFALKLANFNKTEFLLKGKNLEGYLFPDTYYFSNNATETDVIKSMNNNFEKKIIPLLPEITSLGKNEQEVIIMASIIEREAEGDTDRGIISGILWKRINIGMPLEVDSAPVTYKTKGLPSSPIGNPGIKAIEAAINPQSSPYLYYLHDKNGNIHYAETFAEHQTNIKKYLK